MGTYPLLFPMGFFKKKKKAVIVKTFTQALDRELKKKDEEVENYNKLKPRLAKFLPEYKQFFDNYVSIYGDSVHIQFKDDYNYNSDFPDGFFALADKLGLNIEPTCNSGYSDSRKSFNVRAKHS